MEWWYYIEQGIIGLLFLLAWWQLFRVFRPASAGGGCSKGCGKQCAVAHFEKAMEQLEAELDA